MAATVGATLASATFPLRHAGLGPFKSAGNTAIISAIGANQDDYYQDATSATYPVVTTPSAQSTTLLQAGRSLNGATYELRVALLRFDTSAVPDDATITGATLLLTPSDANSGPSTNSLNLLGEYYTWNGTSTDWTNDVPASPILSVPTSTFNGSTATRSVTITDLSGINPSGNTNIRLTVSQRASDAAPTGFNYANIAALDHATLQEPRLVVSYIPASPSPSYYFFGRLDVSAGNVTPRKSTDPIGGSFVTGAASKLMSSAAGTAIEAMWAQQRPGTEIVDVFTQIATGAVYFNYYDMAMDTWGLTTSAITIAASSFAPTVGYTFVSAVYRPTAGELVLAYCAGLTAMASGFNMARYARVNASTGAVIGSVANIDNGGSVDWSNPIAVLGASDRVHFFFQRRTATAGLYQRTLSAANALQTFPGSAWAAPHPIFFPIGTGTSYNDAGTTRVRVPAIVSGQTVSVAKLDSADAPTVTVDSGVSDTAASVLAATSRGESHLRVHDTTQHLLFAGGVAGNSGDLMHDSNSAGSWGTDVNEWAATLNLFSSNIYTRLGATYLATVVDDGGTIKYAEITLAAAAAYAPKRRLISKAALIRSHHY